MDATSSPDGHSLPAFRRTTSRHRAAWIGFRIGARWIAAAFVGSAAVAADPGPAADEPPFRPGELSIGEPIALPYDAAPTAAAQPMNDPRSAVPPDASTGSGGPLPNSGWLGLAVAPSPVPGRWRIEEVTAGGPAARAGIAAGDELRSVNGLTLASPEEVSGALAAIAAGQDVRVAVARDERVTDVVLRAEPRPTVRSPEPSPPAPPLAPSATPSVVAADVPRPAAAPPAATEPPAAPEVPGWRQAQVGDAPPPRDADAGPARPRFGQPAVTEPVAPATAAAIPRFDAPPPARPPEPFVPPAAAAPAVKEAVSPGRIALGVRTVPIDPATQARFRLAEPSGAYVIGVVHELPAGKAGVPPGSVIVALGDQPVRSPLELSRLVTSGPVGRPVAVRFVLPGGQSRQADVVLQPLEAPLEQALVGGVRPVDEPPDLQPGPRPRRAERQAGGGVADGGDVRAEIRSEIRALRSRLDRLERLLETPGRLR